MEQFHLILNLVSPDFKCGAVSPDLVARDFLAAAELGPESTLKEQVTSLTFYNISQQDKTEAFHFSSFVNTSLSIQF